MDGEDLQGSMVFKYCADEPRQPPTIDENAPIDERIASLSKQLAAPVPKTTRSAPRPLAAPRGDMLGPSSEHFMRQSNASVGRFDLDDIFLEEESRRGSFMDRSGSNVFFWKQNQSNHQSSQERRRRLVSLVFVTIFCGLFIAAVTIGFANQSSRERNVRAPPAGTEAIEVEDKSGDLLHLVPRENVPIRIEEIKRKIVDANLSSRSSLEDLHSIPFYALRWLSDTDGAMLDPSDPGLFQRFSLAVFYYTSRPNIAASHSNGETWNFHVPSAVWQNWMSAQDVCNWNGIRCDHEKVIALNLTNTRLEGSLPEEIKALSNLRILDLSHNQLRGTIPDLVDVSKNLGMTKLRTLSLESNQLTGIIPASITGLSSLVKVHLQENNLMGHLPIHLENLQHLEELSLGRNKLHGPLSKITSLPTKLKTFQVDNNHLTGSIPSFIESSNQLRIVSLGSNYITGSIPGEWGNILNKVEFLMLPHNQITGTLPTNFGRLSHLNHLVVNDNQLHGPLPTELGQLRRLKTMLLDTNDFTGILPVQLQSLNQLNSMVVQHNQLSGEISGGICQLKEKELVHLSADCGVSSGLKCDCCDVCY